MQNRKQPRANIPYHCEFSASGVRESKEGKLQDLSLTGCRLSSEVEIAPVGAIIELLIYPGNDAIPLTVDKATVQWVENGEMGITFSEIRPDVQKRIKEICRQLTW